MGHPELPKIYILAHCGPFMKNRLLIVVFVVHMSALCPDPNSLVPIEPTKGQQDPDKRYFDTGNISIYLSKLMKQGYSSRKFQTTFRKLYGHHTDLPCSQI